MQYFESLIKYVFSNVEDITQDINLLKALKGKILSAKSVPELMQSISVMIWALFLRHYQAGELNG